MRNDKNIFCLGACTDGNQVWSINEFGKGLFVSDLERHTTEFLGLLPIKESRTQTQMGAILKHGAKLIMFPWYADSFLEYDLKEKTYTIIPCELPEQYKFIGGGTVKNDTVYYVSASTPTLAKYHIYSKTLEYIKLCDRDRLMRDCEDEPFWGTGLSICCGNQLYIPSAHNNLLLLYDLHNNETKLSALPADVHGISALAAHHNDIYFFPRHSGSVYKKDTATNELTKIESSCGYQPGKGQKALLFEGEVILCDCMGGKLYRIDSDKNKILPFCPQQFPRIIYAGQCALGLFLAADTNEIYLYNGGSFHRLDGFPFEAAVQKYYWHLYQERGCKVIGENKMTVRGFIENVPMAR